MISGGRRRSLLERLRRWLGGLLLVVLACGAAAHLPDPDPVCERPAPCEEWHYAPAHGGDDPYGP